MAFFSSFSASAILAQGLLEAALLSEGAAVASLASVLRLRVVLLVRGLDAPCRACRRRA